MLVLLDRPLLISVGHYHKHPWEFFFVGGGGRWVTASA